jgi:hypothetical protein
MEDVESRKRTSGEGHGSTVGVLVNQFSLPPPNTATPVVLNQKGTPKRQKSTEEERKAELVGSREEYRRDQ